LLGPGRQKQGLETSLQLNTEIRAQGCPANETKHKRKDGVLHQKALKGRKGGAKPSGRNERSLTPSRGGKEELGGSWVADLNC